MPDFVRPQKIYNWIMETAEHVVEKDPKYYSTETFQSAITFHIRG